MSRYIDTDGLIKTLYIQSDNDGFICCTAEDMETLINSMPIADVRENVRGAWVKSHNMDKAVICSNCGEEAWYRNYAGHVTKSNFCPNCGADMRSIIQKAHELHKETNCPLSACVEALEQSNGDKEKAIMILREKSNLKG